jgi:hypothetical protein
MHNMVVKHENQLHQVCEVCFQDALPHPIYGLLVFMKMNESWTCCPTSLYTDAARIFATLTNVETVGFWNDLVDVLSLVHRDASM